MKIDPSEIKSQHHTFEIPIGTKISLKEPYSGTSAWTIFVGMEKNRYILLRLPRELCDIGEIGSPMTVKYVTRNLIFGFNATIIHTLRTPYPLLFLEYPRSVESLDLRDHDRAICFLPMTIYLSGEQFPGHIIDLSRGGCRLAIDPEVAGPLSAIEKGASFFSQFILNGPDPVYVGCEVKNVTKDRQRLLPGVKFINLPEEAGRQIEAYVSKVNEYHADSN